MSSESCSECDGYEVVIVDGEEVHCATCSLRAEVERLRADLAAERAEVERLMDSMEWAWSIIANAQYWDATDTVRHPEWEQAKFKWRDEHWHPALDRNKEARRD